MFIWLTNSQTQDTIKLLDLMFREMKEILLVIIFYENSGRKWNI